MTARGGSRLAMALLLAAMPALPVMAGSEAEPAVASVQVAATAGVAGPAAGGPTVRNGQEIYRRFLDGLADQDCSDDASTRWRSHFGHVPRQLASRSNDVLPLFGYVVEAMREAHLPTEYALIPFIESGYRPGARSASGPAGLWQFIAVTARNHEIPIRPGYDGRLSPADATTAAVRYLKTLHGMFAGDWRLAVMAYNAGEYRVLNALKRAGQAPATADPASLAMPDITHSYVRKLHALSCVIKEAEAREGWLVALDREVPVLQAIPVPDGVRDLDTLASRNDTDAQQLRRLNPAHADGRVARIGQPVQVLVPQSAVTPPVFMAEAPPEPDDAVTASDIASAVARRVHTVVNGDSIWAIARRYGVSSRALLEHNGLDARSVLRPGMELRIDGGP